MEKIDFIDNHYYKCLILNRNFYFYFKYCYSNSNKEILDYYYEIAIYGANLFEYRKNNINSEPFVIKNGFKYEEVELSEIICYLPIGHPDKIAYRNNRIKQLLNGS